MEPRYINTIKYGKKIVFDQRQRESQVMNGLNR